MVSTHQNIDSLSNVAREALVDNLRSCHTAEEILSFERRFNEATTIGPLYMVICDFLRTRLISRGLAAKWITTIMDNRENKN